MNKYYWTTVSSHELFDHTPEDFAKRRDKKVVLPADRKAMLDLLDKIPTSQLSKILKKRKRAQAIA